jgi:hypothetical protein
LASIEEEHRAIARSIPSQLRCQRALPAERETAYARDLERFVDDELALWQRDPAPDPVLDLLVDELLKVVSHQISFQRHRAPLVLDAPPRR